MPKLFPITVETDAIAATLRQTGKLVTFHSYTFQGSEQLHSSVEKEAPSTMKSIKHWRHFLLG